MHKSQLIQIKGQFDLVEKRQPFNQNIFSKSIPNLDDLGFFWHVEKCVIFVCKLYWALSIKSI